MLNQRQKMFINYFKTITLGIFFNIILLSTVLGNEDVTMTEDLPMIWNIQHEDTIFFGRKEILSDLNNSLNSSSYNTNQMVLIGLPGIGKTQTAKRYAKDFYKDYDIVWWFYPSENLDNQFFFLAKAINEKILKNDRPLLISSTNPNETIDQIKDFLRTTSNNWLLIFDDIEKTEQVLKYIPEHHTKSRAHILITSKNAKGWSNYYHLNKFTRETSISLLQTITGDNDILSLSDLAEKLDDYPILVAHAAFTIKDFSLNARQFLETIKKSNSYFNVNQLAASIFQYTLDNITEKSQVSYNLLLFISILTTENIPGVLLEKWFINNNLGNKYEFDLCLSLLIKTSLLSKASIIVDRSTGNTYDLYNIHDIIKNVVLRKMKPEEINKKVKEATLTLSKIMSKKEKRVVLPEFSYIYPQIIHLARLGKTNHIQDNNILELEMDILDYYQIVERNFHKMEEHAKSISSQFNANSRCKTETCARFNTSMSALKWWQGFHKEGIEPQLKALAYYEKNNPQSPERLRGLVYLTSNYSFIGDIENAEKTIKQVELLLNNASPDGSVFYNFNRAVYHQNIAYILSYKGDQKPAMKELKTSFNYINKINAPYPDQKKQLAMYLHFLIQEQEILYFSGEEKNQLDRLFQLYHDGIEALHTKEHRLIGVLSFLIGNSLNLQGKHTEAEAYLKESIRILNDWIGPGNFHKLQAQAHSILGDTYACSDKLIESLQEYLLSEKIYKNALVFLKIEELSMLYEKIIITSIKLKDDRLARHYAKLHRSIFGIDHPRESKILNYFITP